MTTTTTTSANLHKRRESPKEEEKDDDGTTTTTTLNDSTDSPFDDPAKLRKELAVGLVVGQWIVPPLLFLVLPGLSWRYRLEEVWILAILCNALLIMALGYLVQRRIEHWHIRPTIFWVAVPPLMELASHEPDICLMALVVISIPFCFVFTMWCARYGVHNTVRMGLQHLGRSCSLEGIFSRPMVVLTKRYVYDFDKLYNSQINDNEQEDLEAVEKNKGGDQEELPLIPEPGPEELARIRANTAKHLRPYQGILVLLLVWSGWSIYQSTQQLPDTLSSSTIVEQLDRPVPVHHHHTVLSTASAHWYRETGKSYHSPHNTPPGAVPALTRVSSTVVEDKRASLKAA